ncbi:hypothetical protein [Rhodoferax sp. U11-2br]|uniref:hypothetical protein n=1 Tax=Rhodoferax sp. U11-2br TaxID=2838878 RepID=UPI001BE6320C|nr:hypothetical protein [Rhodoferax sp. U11-2br]MBT3066377.1 hypothetical protein [Rhodoferax sp. U11-2br]
MSVFSWLFAKSAPEPTAAAPAVTKSAAPRSVPGPNSVDPLADLKHQRHERRENLYDVVRNVMLRSEVLASHYKFKVLSLDARGRQFLVMIDLLGDQVLAPGRWNAVEQLMAMTAAQRYDLQVKAVYWRLVPHTAAEAARRSAQPIEEPVRAPAEVAIPATPARQGYDPIDNDEVLAFKKAISEASPGTPADVKPGEVLTSGPRKPAPPPGYEDTQLLEPDDAASPLSRTQFGGL